MEKRRVVITGMGAVTPIGNNVETFWKNVKEGKNGIGSITKFDTTDYKVKIAAEVKGFSAKELMDFKAAKRMETFSQYAVAAAKEACADAGFNIEEEDPYRCGVIIGSGVGKSSSVSSSRIIYTPSTFARTSLLHLQEVGSLQAVHPHISQRENLVSFLCFIVLSGEGELSYEGQTYQLHAGDCVFIDCRKAYSHSTSNDLWALQWCHFYAPSLPAVYEKYKERGGRPVFHPADIKPFTDLLTELYNLASSSDYIRDMRINEKLGTLLTLLMEQSWHPESATISRKRMELAAVKEHLDEHFTEKIMLDELAEKFFINKFYLSKIFKETYGTTVNNYLISKRITRAKQLLRFTDMTVDEVGVAVGMGDANYFSRMFRKVEGISPREYRKQW